MRGCLADAETRARDGCGSEAAAASASDTEAAAAVAAQVRDLTREKAAEAEKARAAENAKVRVLASYNRRPVFPSIADPGTPTANPQLKL